MAEALIIEALGDGRAKEIQEMEFDPLPRQGDFITVSMGSMSVKFVVEAVIHKVSLGKKNRIIIRVRPIDKGQAQYQRNQLPQYNIEQVKALPAPEVEVTEVPYIDTDVYFNT